jgi:hypothetical protein
VIITIKIFVLAWWWHMGKCSTEVSACCFTKYSHQKPYLRNMVYSVQVVLFLFPCILAKYIELRNQRVLASDSDEHQTYRVCQCRNDSGKACRPTTTDMITTSMPENKTKVFPPPPKLSWKYFFMCVSSA